MARSALQRKDLVPKPVPHGGFNAVGGNKFTTRGEQTSRRADIMKALVYHRPGKRAWEEVPDHHSRTERRDRARRCRYHLRHRSHILGGDVPEVTPEGSSDTKLSVP